MGANDRQVGGDHYGKTGYQFWDFAHDTGMGYLMGHTNKYMRWRKKGGVQDLEKCLHFIDKCEEVGVEALPLTQRIRDCYARYITENAVPAQEAFIIWAVMTAKWETARLCVRQLIDAS